MKKLLAVILSVALIFALSSCELITGEAKINADEVINGAAEILDGATYITSVSTVFSSDDEALGDTIEALGGKGITVLHKGDDLKVKLNATLGEGVRLNKVYTVVGDTIYHESVLTMGEDGVAVKEKASFSADMREMLLRDAGAAANIGVSDFEDVNAKRAGSGVIIVECAKIKSDAKGSLLALLSSGLEGSGATLLLSDEISYTVELRNSQFHKTTLLASLTVIIGGESYEMGVSVTETYDYESSVEIEEPLDIEMYKDVALENIIG